MAQRRYTQDQINAALASGERAPDMSGWLSTYAKDYIPEAVLPYAQGLERWDRGIVTGFANAIPQIPQVPETLYHLGQAGYDNLVSGKPFRESLDEHTYGKEGVDKLDNYMRQELEAYTAGMSEHERNDPAIMEKLQSAIIGSKGYEDLRLAQTSTVNQLSTQVQDYVRGKMGMQPSYQMTSGDEVADFVGGALLPTPTKFMKAIDALPAIARYPARLAEILTPGSSGVGNAALNVAVPTALTQTLRTVQGAPNYKAGTADLGEQLHSDKTDRLPQAAPEPVPQRRVLPPMVEDAPATGPFSIAAEAAQGTSSLLPFQYDVPELQSTATTEPAPAPDRDQDAGGNGSGWAKALGVGGALALVAAAARGRLPPGLRTRVIQDVDSVNAARTMQPRPTDIREFGRPARGSGRDTAGLSTWQKIKTGGAKSNAPEYIAENALDPNDPLTKEKLARINRENHAASRLETGYAAKRTYTSGELPGVNRRTLKTTELRKVHDSLTPDEQALFKKHVVFNERMDHFNNSVNSAQDEINDLYIKLRTMTNPTRRMNTLSEIRAKEADVRARTDPAAEFEQGVSVGEARRAINDAMAHPKINALVTAMKKISDDVDEVGIHFGQYTHQYLRDSRIERPNFLPLATDPSKYVDLATGVTKRKGKLARIGDALTGRKEPHEKGGFANTMYGGIRSPARTNALTKDVPWDALGNPLDALETRIFDMHRQLRSNQSAANWTETIAGTADWGRSVRRAHPPLSISEFEKNRNRGELAKILKNPLTYVYNKNGEMHIMQAADTEVARAMRHNPSSALAMMDGMRKIQQSLYTGNTLAPWFAPVAAENDLAVARVMMPSHRVTGYLDALMQRVFPRSPIGKVFRNVFPDPTMKLRQLAAVNKQILSRAVMKGGEILGKNVALQSTLIRALGPASNSAMGQAMIRSVNDMITEFKFMEMHNIIDNKAAVEQNERIFTEFAGAWEKFNSIPGIKQLSPVFGEAFRGWLAVVDAVRNSSRYGIASANLAKTMRETGNNPSNKVMRELVHDMRYMSGDMSKAIGNPVVANIASAVPYGQNAINSVLHLTEGLKNNSTVTATRIMTNMVLPKFLWVTALTALIGKEFSDHYWDDMPTWQRQGTVPMLSPEYLLEQAQSAVTGGPQSVRQPTINDVIFMRQAPEAIPFAEVFMNGWQAAGWFNVGDNKHVENIHTYGDMLNAIGSMMNVSIPAVDNITRLFTDAPGKNATDMSSDSDTVMRFTDALHAMAGGTFDVVQAGFSAASDSYQAGNGWKALVDGASHAYEAGKQRFPETPLSPLFGNQRRHYTKGAARDRNMSKFKAIDEVSGQLSSQKADTRLPGPDAPKTQDPVALTMMRDMHATANQGVMKVLRTERADLYKQITRLDDVRGRMSPSEYTANSERLKMAINDKDRQMEEIFDRLTVRLQNHYAHLGVTDIESAKDYIRKTMTP